MPFATLPGSPPFPSKRSAGNISATEYSAARAAESKLIRRVLGGEVDLFYELVRPCERSMFFAAQSLLGNETDVEDVVQEAAFKAFRALGTFRHEAKFSTWMVQITINEAKAKLRKDRRHLYQSIDETTGPEGESQVAFDLPDCREIPSETLLRKELREMLMKALNSLPQIYSVVLKLRDVQNFSTEETAEALGLSEANVKTRLSRARGQMRNTLGQQLYRCSLNAKVQ